MEIDEITTGSTIGVIGEDVGAIPGTDDIEDVTSVGAITEGEDSTRSRGTIGVGEGVEVASGGD